MYFSTLGLIFIGVIYTNLTNQTIKPQYTPCMDKYAECALWKKANLCASQSYNDYMAFTCPVTCGICGGSYKKDTIHPNQSEPNDNNTHDNTTSSTNTDDTNSNKNMENQTVTNIPENSSFESTVNNNGINVTTSFNSSSYTNPLESNIKDDNQTQNTNPRSLIGQHIHSNNKRSDIPFSKKFAHALSHNKPYFIARTSKLSNQQHNRTLSNNATNSNNNTKIQPNEMTNNNNTMINSTKIGYPRKINTTSKYSLDQPEIYTNYPLDQTTTSIIIGNELTPTVTTISPPMENIDTITDDSDETAQNSEQITSIPQLMVEATTTTQPIITQTITMQPIDIDSTTSSCETRKFKIVINDNYCKSLQDKDSPKYKILTGNIIKDLTKYISVDGKITQLEFPDECHGNKNSQHISVVFTVCANDWTVNRFRRLYAKGNIGSLKVVANGFVEILDNDE